MKVSTNWLRDFVELPPDLNELKRRLMNLGLGVESISVRSEDWILEVEVTTNRPDCLSHYGIAREIAAAYGKPLKKLITVVKEVPASASVSIDILDPDLAPRYCGRVLLNVRVGPSPEWLVRRLEAVGMRPINNIADVTNYVLLELGHPLHAFDLDRIHQRKIVVRRARAGESLTTLDGIDRHLTPENLVIADAGRPVALAGIMGGLDSGIAPTTHNVLVESAWFDPVSIRRTARALGMHTEASHRFERGADIEMAPKALDRAAALITAMGAGEILDGALEVYPRPRPRVVLKLHSSEIRRILGTEITDVERTLRSLGFTIEPLGKDEWSVTPPSFRLDITREVDLIEEIARSFGYDRLPSRLLPTPPRVEKDPRREKELALSATLAGLGYRQIVTSSMVDPAENARFNELSSVVLQNPLSQEASALRTTAIPSLLAAFRWNLDRDACDLRFFETGKVYWQSEDGPQERWVLALGLTGRRRAASIHEGERELDFFDVKGDIETLLAAFEMRGSRFTAEAPHYYESGMRGAFFVDKAQLTVFGRIAADRSDHAKLRQPVWAAEIDLERLLAFPLRRKTFHPYSKFPAVERDFSLVIRNGITYEQVASRLSNLSLPELLSFRPVDWFRGGPLGPDQRGLLLRVVLQSATHTLTGDEITAISENILNALGGVGIRLRS